MLSLGDVQQSEERLGQFSHISGSASAVSGCCCRHHRSSSWVAEWASASILLFQVLSTWILSKNWGDCLSVYFRKMEAWQERRFLLAASQAKHKWNFMRESKGIFLQATCHRATASNSCMQIYSGRKIFLSFFLSLLWGKVLSTLHKHCSQCLMQSATAPCVWMKGVPLEVQRTWGRWVCWSILNI